MSELTAQQPAQTEVPASWGYELPPPLGVPLAYNAAAQQQQQRNSSPGAGSSGDREGNPTVRPGSGQASVSGMEGNPTPRSRKEARPPTPPKSPNVKKPVRRDSSPMALPPAVAVQTIFESAPVEYFVSDKADYSKLDKELFDVKRIIGSLAYRHGACVHSSCPL